MGRATFLFHGSLNDFLPAGQRGRELEFFFGEAPSLKHAIESFGVPHPEVGRPADLGARLHDGVSVDVHPADYTTPRGAPWTFVLDCQLGRLAKYLRILGFDTTYSNRAFDLWLAVVSQGRGRALLTRDRRLLMRKMVERGYFVRAVEPRAQLLEVLDRFGLRGSIHPLRRCLRCNGELRDVDKSDVWERIPPKTREWCEHFKTCGNCGQLYWEGSHWERMLAWAGEVRNRC